MAVTWGDVKAWLDSNFVEPNPNPLNIHASTPLGMLEEHVLCPTDGHNLDNACVMFPDVIPTPQDLVMNAMDTLTALLAGNLQNFLGVPTLADVTKEITGSVFYPATPGGLSPVVGATVEIFEFGLQGFLASTPLVDYINGLSAASATPGKTDYQGRYVVTITLKPYGWFFIARITKPGELPCIRPLIFLGLTGEFLPLVVPLTWMDVPQYVEDFRRPDLNRITGAGSLADALMRLVTVDLIRLHMLQIDHMEFLFIDHKHYIWQLEKKLLKEPSFKQHVPLPQWQPVSTIPDEMPTRAGLTGSFFQVVMLDDFNVWGVNGIINPGYNNLPPQMKPVMPPELQPASFGEFHTAMELAQFIGRSAASAPTSFHFMAHVVLGGPFFNMMTAAAATIFWPVHALLVDVYDHWVKLQFTGLRSYHLGNRKIVRPKPHSHHGDTIAHDDEIRRDYIEIYAISEKKELWRVYERHVVHMRDDRPFDPQFDPHEILGCNEPAWVHFSHWENLTVKKTNPSPMLHNHAPDHDDHPEEKGTVGGHNHHDHGFPKPVEVDIPDVHIVKDLHWPKKLPRKKGREVIIEKMIDCDPVEIKTTTDIVTGRVIVLAMEEDGSLCLLRPAAGDCNKCGDPVFTCLHLGFKALAFDIAMKDDGTLEIVFVQKETAIAFVVRETGYNHNDFDLNRNGKTLYQLPATGQAQVKMAKDHHGRMHAFISDLAPIDQSADPSGATLNYDHNAANDLMLYFYEADPADWTMATEPFSKKCHCSFEVVIDRNNRINVIAINGDDGKVYFKTVSIHDENDITDWKEIILNDKAVFFHLATCNNGQDQPAIELFALDRFGKCFENRSDGSNWRGWMEIEQIAIMDRKHKALFARLDYTGCVKVFIHAEDNFIYMAEEEGKGSGVYLGWLNI